MVNYSNLEILLPNLELQKKDGKQKEKSKQSKLKADIEDIFINQRYIKNIGKLFIQESLQENKVPIFKDKLIFSKNDFPIMKSLQISDLDSISKEKDCKPYWNDSSKKLSEKLWSPIKIDSVDLDLTYSTLYSNNTEPFLRSLTEKVSKNLLQNSQKTSCQSLQCSLPDITVNEPIMYTRKIRIYPTKEHKELFNKCAGANRYFYNKANNFIKDEYSQALEKRLEELTAMDHCGHFVKKKNDDDVKIICYCTNKKYEGFFCKKHQKSKLGIDMSFFDRSTIRDAILPSKSELTEETKWQKEIPYDTKQLAIDQCMAAYKSNFALKKNGHIDTFDVKYKTKKSSQTFQINKKAIDFEKFLIFQKRVAKKFKVRKRDIEKLKEGADGTVTMMITKSRKYYLCIPRTKKQTYEPSPFKSVFLDPGERTFMTYYSPDGICGKIGDDYANTYVLPILKKIDKFESLRAKCDNKTTRYRMKRRIFKLYDKVKNRVNDSLTMRRNLQLLV